VEACERDVNTLADLDYLREKYADAALHDDAAARGGRHSKVGEL
jgi:hypothetical protein